MITLSSTESHCPLPWSTPSSNVYQSQWVRHSSLHWKLLKLLIYLTKCRPPSSTSSPHSSPQQQKLTSTIHWTLMTTSLLLILQSNKFELTTPTNVITTPSIQPRNMWTDIVPFVPTRDLKNNTTHCHWGVESANYLPKKLSRSWMIQMPVQPVVSPTVPIWEMCS